VKRLTVTEQILLLAIWRLNTEAYGVKIRELFCLYTEIDVGFGTMYNNLDQLVRKDTFFPSKGNSQQFGVVNERYTTPLLSWAKMHCKLPKNCKTGYGGIFPKTLSKGTKNERPQR
jgi:hypothetical protein